MHFLKYIELHNYLNLKHAKLKDLKDLNIIIGPNNCGKTSLLRAVNLLNGIDFGRYSPAFSCKICEDSWKQYGNILSLGGSIDKRDKYLTRSKVDVIFGYDRGEIEKILPKLSEKKKDLLNRIDDAKIIDHLDSELRQERLVVKEQKGLRLAAEHISPIIWDEVKTKIFNHILFCPDERLQTYKGNQIPEYIKSRNLTTSAQRQIIEFLKGVIDPKMIDFRYSLELDRDVENQPFTTSIAEQGSGVKSLICLVADILSDRQAKMLLIDEPELGLNPSGKHAFLNFLLKQSKDKQIFLATHDPTFVNPILWNRENVSIYLFSMIDSDFVKVDLAQSKQDPSTFAGFLPHTTSLKQVHIYVEGTTDVHIFQMFLDRYVKERFKEDCYHILNKIGIFHLAGDFWSHLLYTIPKRPYTSIVVLDGDKKKIAREIVNKYSTIERNRYKLFDSLDELLGERKRKKPIITPPCPIYCLKRSKIEDYLETKLGTIILRPTSKDEGPSVAFKMDYAPQEIEQLFEAIFQMANMKKMRKGDILGK